MDNTFLASLNTFTGKVNIEGEVEKQENFHIYDSVPECLKAKKNSKSRHNLLGYLESLKTMLGDTKNEVIKHLRKEREKSQYLQKQVQESNNLQVDIVSDFEKVKNDVIEGERELNLKNAEIETYKAAAIDIKDQMKRRDDTIMEMQQDNTRFIWGVVYALFSIKQKFDGNQLFQELIRKNEAKIKLMEILSKEINDPERNKGLSLEEKKEAIMHLINVINDITTTLHSEIQIRGENAVEAQKLRHKLEQQKLEFEMKITEFNKENESKIYQLKKEYEEKYNKFIESSKQEVVQKEEEANKELENMIFECRNHKQRSEDFQEEVNDLRKDIAMKSKSNNLLHSILISLLFRAEELIFQKNLLKREYSFLRNQLSFSNEEIDQLKQTIDTMVDRIGLKSMKDSMFNTIKSQKDLSMSISELQQLNNEDT